MLADILEGLFEDNLVLRTQAKKILSDNYSNFLSISLNTNAKEIEIEFFTSDKPSESNTVLFSICEENGKIKVDSICIQTIDKNNVIDYSRASKVVSDGEGIIKHINEELKSIFKNFNKYHDSIESIKKVSKEV